MNMLPLRIAFMGSADFSAFAFDALCAAGYIPVLVFSQPDKARGRGHKTTPTIISQRALANHIPLYTPKSWDDDMTTALQQANIDVVIVVAYGLILPGHVLDIPRFGCLNIHPSDLPRWRGAAPLQRAIEAGDQHSAVCIMRMDSGVDTGDIVWRSSVRLDPIWDAGDWHDHAGQLGAQALVELLPELDNLQAQPQSNNGATYARMLSKTEGQICFDLAVQEIIQHIRAFSPKPGAWCLWKNKRLRLYSAIVIDKDAGNNTTVYDVGMVLDDVLTIQTQHGTIRPQYVQLEGKAKMCTADFLRGHEMMVGTILQGKRLKA